VVNLEAVYIMVYGNLMNKLLSSIGMPVGSIPYCPLIQEAVLPFTLVSGTK